MRVADAVVLTAHDKHRCTPWDTIGFVNTSSMQERSYPADEAACRAALQFRQEVG